mmetsp:Transcript_32267/g.58995  ORF Transcript_32267/g.58995 Transcript_32267/m.58995 type:complete len:347 (+) Transcript_32267:80-1120(+)
MMPGVDNDAMTTYLQQGFWCCFYGAGIIGLLLIYGVLQERIMTVPYGGPDGEKFSDSVFLIMINRMCAILLGLGGVLLKGESLVNTAPLWKYLTISLTNVYASTCQYEALKYVSFPVQMLGKSFKMMPVMMWGMVVSGKSYKIMDWVIAAAVTGGVTEFLMTGPISEDTGTSTSARGLAYLLLFLALDGLTSTMQELVFAEHKTSRYNQMMYVNTSSTVVSIITLIFGGGFGRTYAFIGNYPKLLFDSLLLGASSASSQWFILAQVEHFGALVFAATMNVRQVVSIVNSYIMYHHHITWLQICGLIVIFTALFYKSLRPILNKPEGEKKPLLESPEAIGTEKKLNP